MRQICCGFVIVYLFAFFCPMEIKLKNKKNQNETATPNEKKKSEILQK